MHPEVPTSSRQALEAVLLDESKRGKLFAYARSRFGIGAVEAEDLLQETALELLRYRSYVRSPEGFLFTVFRSRCMRFVGACQSRRRVLAGPPTEDTPASGTPERTDRQLALRQALDEVSSACRKLLCAYYVEGRSLREAASVMSLEYSSVGKTISRCLQRLRKCLA